MYGGLIVLHLYVVTVMLKYLYDVMGVLYEMRVGEVDFLIVFVDDFADFLYEIAEFVVEGGHLQLQGLVLLL